MRPLAPVLWPGEGHEPYVGIVVQATDDVPAALDGWIEVEVRAAVLGEPRLGLLAPALRDRLVRRDLAATLDLGSSEDRVLEVIVQPDAGARIRPEVRQAKR